MRSGLHVLRLAAAAAPAHPPRSLRFEVLHRSEKSGARVARIHLPSGRSIDTPAFVPVATTGAIRAIGMATPEVDASPLVFCNTFHLLLQPGPDTVARAGGLHRFTGRDGPIITDSGGFQIFSLAAGEMDLGDAGLKGAGQRRRPSLVVKVDEDGVTFRSYIDGKKVRMTPESSVECQKQLGADIIIPLDEVLPFNADAKATRRAFKRSHRWQYRSLQRHLADPRDQAMFCVIHGGTDIELRRWSTRYLGALPFDGTAIGGSLGKDRAEMVTMLKALMPGVPTSRPTHLLGIGDAESIAAAIPLGLDTFDSCYPTRLARHGGALFHDPESTTLRKIDVRKRLHSDRFSDSVGGPHCACSTCATSSLAFLHHLFKAGEHAAGALLTTHNLAAMRSFMAEVARQIKAGIIYSHRRRDFRCCVLRASSRRVKTKRADPPALC